MIEWLTRAALSHRRGVLIFWSVCAAAALALALRLPLDALPDLTNNQVIVLTVAPGLSPEEVELTVTRPIELALAGLAGVEDNRSLSRYGISSVTVIFEDEVDAWRARQMVAERLQGITLPDAVEPPALAPLTGGLGEIFHLALSSPIRPPAELLEISNLRIVPLLKSVPGVVEVNSWGGAVRTFDVVADPARMSAHGMTLRALGEALSESSGVVAGGSVALGDGMALVRGQARPRTLAELSGRLIKPPTLRAGDVGRVEEGSLLRLGAATLQGRGETVYLMAQMLRDQNALSVMQKLHARMPAVRAALPPDVRIDVIYDRSVLVNKTLRTVGKNLLEGFALVVFVLLVFLGQLRAGLIAASVIPLSMVMATAVMAFWNIPGNLMSLGALDFGLLVDGAVVMVEGVFHVSQLHKRAWAEHVRTTAVRAARPVFFSVLVIMLVYVPVLSLGGTDGKLFRPMALTVVLALVFSLLLSLTWVPALLATLVRPEHVPERPPLIVRILDAGYARLLPWLFRARWLVIAAVPVLFASGYLLFRGRGVEFTPELDEGDLVIQTTRPPDISLETATERALRMERLLARVPEVERAVSRIGSPALATDIMGFEQADVFVALKPKSAWRPGLSRAQLVSELEQLLAREDADNEPAFTQPIQMRFNELLGGAVTDVAVSVYGTDLAALRKAADAVAAQCKQVRGARDVRVLAPPEVPLLNVEPRGLTAGQYGFTTRDVLDAVKALRVGLVVGQTWEGPQRIPLRLKLAAPAFASTLSMLPLPSPQGTLVPLASVADVSFSTTPGQVSRRNGERRLVVGFNVRGRDLAAVVEEAAAKSAQSVRLPRGYRVEWGGQYESLTAAKRRLALIIPITLALILGLLTATFGSLRHALLVFGLVPVAAVGGVAVLTLRDLPISLPAAIGFIALSGISVMNGVVWMARALELSEANADGKAVALRAAHERARPVLMTALVAALGFVPMMLSSGEGSEVQRPLASVVVGGLFTSTLLTLVVLPVLYPLTTRRQRQGEA